MKKIAILIIIATIVGCRQKEELIVPEKPTIVVPVKPKCYDFRDSLIGTYQLQKDSTYTYDCIKYSVYTGSGVPTCLQKGYLKDYTKSLPFNIEITYDSTSVDVFEGSAPMRVNSPNLKEVFSAVQTNKELTYTYKTYYSSSLYHYKIVGDNIYYTTFASPSTSPFSDIVYYSGKKNK